jgi:demethylmenaquinone methyltransferase/2-methoxy-6-polyprenyl-1,4-benzoquinol methylase
MNTSTRYEKAAPTWSRKLSRHGYDRAYSGFLVKSALASGAVLDVGTGTGTFAISWVEAGGSTDLTLLDPSTAMLEQASSHFSQRGLCPKVVNCEFEDFSNDTKFDAILASHVLEHFPDPSGAIHRFAQKLSPGGCLYLIVSKPHWCNWMIWLRFRHQWFRPEIICEMAQDAGLTGLRLHTFRKGPPSRTSLGYIFSKP